MVLPAATAAAATATDASKRVRLEYPGFPLPTEDEAGFLAFFFVFIV